MLLLLRRQMTGEISSHYRPHPAIYHMLICKSFNIFHICIGSSRTVPMLPYDSQRKNRRERAEQTTRKPVKTRRLGQADHKLSPNHTVFMALTM